MSEGIRHNIALRLPLQPVIAYCGCSLQCRLDVTWLYKTPSLLRVVRPYSSQAIGLQLNTHLEAIGLDLVCPSLR